MNLKKHVLGILLAMAVPVCAMAQSVTVKGQVKDDSGEPLMAAAVAELGTTNGTVTDLNGNYSITVPSNATLQFSFMGYKTQTIAVAGKSTINVTLSEDDELLDEVVVIGYGVQKKSDLTGAVASVRSESLKALSTTDAAQALQGKVSGINVLSNGAPGSGAEIRVRGYSSNGGNISPLYIVDGLQVSSIQYLDPSMIESIEILKDAASAAIYGAQAGNGVVLVTTKTGNESKATINYTGKFTRQDYTKRPMMNRENFLAYKRQEMTAAIVDADLTRFNDTNSSTDTDWISAYMEPSWSKQHSLSVSGGNKSGHYFTSLNYVYNNGVVKGDKDVYQRLTAQVNADYNIFKWFQIGTTNSIEKWSTKSVSQRGYTSSFEQMLLMDPMTPVYWTDPSQMSIEVKTAYDAMYDANGELKSDYTGPAYRFLGDENGWFANTKYSDMEGSALAKRDISDGTSEGFNINGTMYANLMPIKGLTITSRLGYRLNQSYSSSYQAPYYIGGRGSSTTYSISSNASNGYYYQWENFANYNVSLGKNNIGVMAGFSYRETNSYGVNASASGNDILKSYEENFRYMSYLKDGVTPGVSSAPSRSASEAFYGRLTYSFDNRYNLQANFRADAFDSSKLSKDNRWGYFPSVSAGWTVSNESFWKDNLDSSAFNFLKIRASWGRNGNVSVLSGYPYISTITKGSSWYQYGVATTGNTDGSAPSKLANPNLHWEISEQVDLGLDARFLDNRLTLGIDYYDKHTKDLLFSVSTPPELGVTSVMSNGGDVQNKGLEFELGWRDRIGALNYNVSANFTTLHNEVISLAEGAAPEYKTDASSTNYQIRNAFEPGYSIWYLNGYKYAGMDAQGYPTYYGFDENGNEVVKDHTEVGTGDMQFIGNSTPTYTYGLNINLEYKGFDFTLNGYGQGGNYILPVLHRTGYKNNLQYYKDEMDAGKLPAADKVVGDYVFWSSTANLFKGDYFRFKTLQLGYTLPSKLTRKAAISNLRLYVSLDDFFTITKYPGLDPETASTNNTSGAGLDWGSYPTMQKLILGVNLTF